MKNFTVPTSLKTMIFSALITVIGMFSISSTDVYTQEGNYQVVNQKAFIAGAGKLKNWKAEINNFDCSGRFVGREGELGSISDFSFSLDVEQLDNVKEASALEQAILDKGCKEIVFTQNKMMILPIMKMVYMGGDVKIKDGTHASPIYLSYELDDDQNIKVTGKQHVRLSEFGIKAKNIDAGALEDEIVINIEFTLVRPQYANVDNKPAEAMQIAARKADSKRADTRD